MSVEKFSQIWSNKSSAPSLDSLNTDLFKNKIILVTGANSGLGLEAARHYVRLGAAKVIIAVRTTAKGNTAKKDIEGTTALQGIIEVWNINYDSFASIQAFVARIDRETPRLDIALLNAGVSKAAFSLSSEGWEETIQVNVLSTVFLAVLLLPKLRSSKNARWTPHLSFVDSVGHKSVHKFMGQDASNVLEALNKPETFGGINFRYMLSKLLLVYAVEEIAQAVLTPGGDPEIIVNYSCPDMTRSGIARDFTQNPVLSTVMSILLALFAKTTEEGSRTVVKASGLDKSSHGRFFYRDQILSPGILVISEEGRRLQKKVWGEIVGVLSKHSNEFRSILKIRN